MGLWSWLLGGAFDLGYVRPWNPVIAEQHEAATAHLLLGACGPARIVGNRTVERREAAVDARRAAEAAQRPRLARRSA